MSGKRPPFEQRLKRALASPDLPVALDRTLSQFRARRARAMAEIDFPTLRADVTARRQYAIDHLPELIKRFTEEARGAGAQVHMAADAAQARQIIGNIARENGVTLAVKGKSMATEEIELNPYLEEIGVTPVETDLGEWIIQLAGDSPSHLIAPAIHWKREQVAALFNRVLGEQLDPDDIPGMVNTARLKLRQKFIDAGMGITGANVAIAESGTVVIVTNEGNERLAASLPPIHVAVLGIEKIVPAIDDAAAVLKLLARSATGQKQSSYVSFITGPSRTGDIELSLTIGVHGPKQMHIVLVDNGRTGMLADPDFREALRCIRCAACSNVCPPFSIVGGQVFGHIYTGPIGLVLTPWHHGVEAAAGPQSLCFSCNACEQVCPVGIPLARLILDVREQATKAKGVPLAKRAGFSMLAGGGGPLASAGKLLQKPLGKGGGFIGGPMLPGSDWRHLPELPAKSFTERLSTREREGAVLAQRQPPIPGAGAHGLRVAYFPGCITDRFYPAMGEAVVRLLQAAGAEVVVPPQTGCCGLPAQNSGDRARAAMMAKSTIEALRPARVDYIVSSSTSCAVCIGQDYPHILRDESGWQSRAAELAPRVIDLTHFLDSIARFPAGALSGSAAAVTYHDSCQSFNCLGLDAEGRRLVRDVAGGAIVEMADSSTCCGFGGTTSFEHPEVARRIAEKKIATIEATGAGVVLADNPGCIMHLRGALHARQSSIRVQHLAEYLAGALPAGKG
jgi:L-lactate dehydrogenase complex protein LldF